MPTPITLIATLTLHQAPDALQLEGLEKLVNASRAEAGCLQYDLHQQHSADNVLVMIEQWLDAEALAAHQATAHYRAFGAAFNAQLVSVELNHLRRII
ncbi:putative quinol monooxygenase [Pseudomonas paeninsulae]|uniref:putative quinol monooxygenase n=1 Tax=Pseudomonas paeninsulae TaxID=3110772 RepID=UPI002D765599|nr:putative quinol monooxygenase [Pseudomonas sp. IT1137]